MGVFFKKDFLVYWRDRKEMLIALFMPLLLILVLGFALPNWVENSNGSLEMKAALVIKDQQEEGVAAFQESLNGLSISTEEKNALSRAAEGFHPEVMLMNMFGDEEVNEFLQVAKLDEKAALAQLKEEQVEAVIMIPEGYTLAALNKLLLQDGDGAALVLTAAENSMKVSVLQNMLDGLLGTVNYQAALSSGMAQQGSLEEGDHALANGPVGGLEQIEGVDMITSFQYYALAVSIFFALSVSTTTASKSITEKREMVFMRLLLAGTHPFRYLSGKVGSTLCMSLLQSAVLILVSHVLFQLFPGKSMIFWIGFAFLIFMLCLTVAALSALYTAMLFRMNDADVATGISFILLVVLGVIGGNLVPIYILPDWLMQIGSVTPNGLALMSIIQWIQGIPFQDLWLPILYQGLFFVIILAASLWIFPRRGRI
ncbi:ABC transporter permease [Paenibacillus lautus]|uniref:ABC transporter permease n=1 Tax=Paenibacillus lautus TaxID=1401 RepID=A0A385TR48_PAELA|nr:ABC transporter permease [Paenibacillus lautus]AYB44897.1 ABC transporter permease [Paenibacillus lautus]